MELQVFVNSRPRDVCGVHQNTTAEEVVNVLCQSLHLTGPYCLVAYWRNNEIVFSPSECPLSLINRVGEHLKQFQFFLRQIDTYRSPNPLRTRSPIPISHHHHRRFPSNPTQSMPFQNSATSYNQPQERHLRRPEDKEVEAAFASHETGISAAAELRQLSSVDWNKRIEEERQHQRAILDDRCRLQNDIKRLDHEIHQVRSRVHGFESELASEVTNLLNAVEKALIKRRKIIADLSTNPEIPLLPPSTKTPPVCDEVMI